jgi:hypothetical protein
MSGLDVDPAVPDGHGGLDRLAAGEGEVVDGIESGARIALEHPRQGTPEAPDCAGPHAV